MLSHALMVEAPQNESVAIIKAKKCIKICLQSI